MECPCKDCAKRHRLCWDDCSEYMAYKEERKEIFHKLMREEQSRTAGFRPPHGVVRTKNHFFKRRKQ